MSDFALVLRSFQPGKSRRLIGTQIKHGSIKMIIPSIIIFLTILAAIAAVMGYENWHALPTNSSQKLALCISAVGVLGFVAPIWLTFFPRELLDHFELPNTVMQADRLTAPDGRVFIVSLPILRVQRYGPEGFEKSFYVGKGSSSAMSTSGNILICTYGGLLFTYTPDGDVAPPRGSCKGGLAGSTFSYASKAKAPAIAFNWFSALAVPLWHPVLGWGIALIGGLLLKVTSWPDGRRHAN